LRVPYFVYAIRLDRELMGDRPPKAFRDQNWHMDWDYPLHDECEYYYVGQSAHTPQCRFEQHKHCHGPALKFKCICKIRSTITKSRSNRFVRKYGLFLQDQLFDLGHCAFYN